ncbi:MAG: 2-nitropropane dioxygenase, partial [Bradymonadaceae bacterium]
GVRAKKLHELYRSYDSIEAIPFEVREKVETEIFQKPMTEVWEETRLFFESQDPHQIERAESDAHHKLALICRWYLGLSSKWAIHGVEGRRMDYQVWMGPAQGAFNAWARGTYLEAAENRTVVQMALNLLEGAAVISRTQQCRTYGIAVPGEAFDYRPRKLR